MTKQFGLVGYPLSHSFSSEYFAGKFAKENINATYKNFELKSISVFPSFLKNNPLLCGLNVTIPYKKEVIVYLDSISDEAKKIGAVNCIDIRNGKLIGYNTDVLGFEKSLLPLIKSYHQKALVLGTGGASEAVKFVLQKIGIGFLSVSRKEKAGAVYYHKLNKKIIQEYTLIINTTPLGMFPHKSVCPDIPYDAITEKHLLYDLIYNPGETKFLSLGKANGAAIKNGLEMLEIQAEESWRIWNQPTV